MKTNPAIVLLALLTGLAVLAAAPSFGQAPSPSRPAPSRPAPSRPAPSRITSADFPQVARRIDFFEKRVNSPRRQDREDVVSELNGGWHNLDKEAVALLKRIVTDDPDPVVRGLAVSALHGAWMPLDPEDLPATFTGYHRQQLLDRRDKDLCAKLIGEVKRGGVEAGYAAYCLGVLRCKTATPELRNLAESDNEFVRYSAARALIDCGDKEGAAPILTTLMNHGVPATSAIRDIVDPHYQALAARAYMELGPAQKKAGIQRLIALMKDLETWQDPNADSRLTTARRLLAGVSGEFFATHREARMWYEGGKK